MTRPNFNSSPGATVALVLGVTLGLTGCAAGGGGPTADTSVLQAAKCQRLAETPVTGGKVTSAEYITATGSTPNHCYLKMTLGDTTTTATFAINAHDIEMRLPDPAAWTGRYLHLGGGGNNGVVPSLSTVFRGNGEPVAQGFAVMASNNGHRDATRGTGAFVDAGAIERNAFAAIGQSDTVSKPIVANYYGAPIKRSYFVGCSAGGRDAMKAASVYSNEYDGVIASSPGVNAAGAIMAYADIYKRALVQWLSPERIKIYDNALMARCDGIDGLTDGIIAKDSMCPMKPADIQCKGSDTSACLTAEEVKTLNRILAQTRLKDGTLLYAGMGMGPMAARWAATLQASIYNVAGAGRVRDAVYRSPNYDFSHFSVDDAYPIYFSQFGSHVVDPASVVDFLARGKKVIIWQGSGDTLISPNDVTSFYDKLKTYAGTTLASANSRYYIAPSVGHCSGGNGADTVDLLTPLINWVEKGIAPGNLVATKVSNGATQFSRPLCAYPQYPKYVSGDPTKAESFTCTN